MEGTREDDEILSFDERLERLERRMRGIYRSLLFGFLLLFLLVLLILLSVK